MSIELRQAEPADAAAIRQLTGDAYAKWVPVIGREPQPMTVDYDVAVQQHRFDTLFRKGLLSGLVETIDEGDQLLIENLAVRPDCQGEGIGRLLLAHVEQLAVDLGKARIRLYTRPTLCREYLRIYEHVGYQIDREENYGKGIAIHMSKPARARVRRSAGSDSDRLAKRVHQFSDGILVVRREHNDG